MDEGNRNGEMVIFKSIEKEKKFENIPEIKKKKKKKKGKKSMAYKK